MDSLIRQMHDIDNQLSKLNSRSRELRQKKQQARARLQTLMEKRGIEEYKGYRVTTLQPKSRPRKKQAEKKRDAIALFTQIGAPDPNGLWDQLQYAMKSTS